MSLPTFIDSNQNLMLMQTKWKSQLDPILANPTTDPSILKGVALVAGANVINTLLGRVTQGWYISDVNAPITIYRSAPFNKLTLTLTSSGSALVNIVIF